MLTETAITMILPKKDKFCQNKLAWILYKLSASCVLCDVFFN